MKSFNTSTKKGIASLYVVIFATILFGVITLSFIRIILSEANQSSNDDLSQSAYDSALAGVEDATIAVNQYYQCLSNGGTPNGENGGIDCRKDEIFGGNCDDFKLRDYLYHDRYDGEVLIQESTTNSADQAYTCVIISDTVADYRSTLTSDTRTRVVPIGIGSTTNGNGTADISQVKRITFRWYSEVNGTDQFKGLDNNGKLSNKNNATTPPVISLTLLKTNANFRINDFNTDSSPDYSTMILLPSSKVTVNGTEEVADFPSDGSFKIENAKNVITQTEISRAGMANQKSETPNNPFLIKCAHTEFACTVDLGSPSTGNGLNFAAGGNAMLIVSMPYGDTITDFNITLWDENDNPIQFVNTQISVDSTGRANQLVRRVESRLDPADVFFPYPQYEVELSGSDEDSLSKYFWITNNCWTEGGNCPNNGPYRSY